MLLDGDEHPADANTLLDRRAAASPTAPFLVFEDDDGNITEITYAEQVRRATATAELLARLGVGVGDRVHLMTANCPQFLDVWFGCGRLGAVTVPVNPLSTVAETAHQLRESRAVLSVVAPTLRDTALAAGSVPVLTTVELNERRQLPNSPTPHAARDGLAAIMFTSGTTSAPKGVRVTHANYVRVGAAIAGHLAMSNSDRWLVTLPLFHANAQYYCLMSALTVGGSVALTSRFSASRWPRQARTLRPTLASLFAAPVRMVLARTKPDAADAANELRLVLFAQNLAPAQVEEFESRFGALLVQLYGMTETVLPPFVNPPDSRRSWDSIGRPLPHLEIRLVDADGRPVSPGTTGELHVRGNPGVDITDGYDGRPAETAALLPDGWLRTGDLVRMDDDGRAYFVDRAKDMVKRAGENVSATEVEQVIGTHPAVLEAAVHGVPDEVYDEAIVAHVVLKPGDETTPEELIAWCRRHLSTFKIPDQVIVRAELPRTSVGKIRKDVLRAELALPHRTAGAS
ncbi:class I adenylate-forming enzyme family protein [Saccharopolyspora sp. ASAGF58]|uniref:class I adenylate-forming enzyme family protein n=1 Tax=Saccharopolyspora sp. ASAGF58 TaxID=2719023 RepID=UPI001440087B|nr:AMP-binding protein [Saccharopolyspora sp. ASAGF58]QIZ36887.1 ATP-dependent acyl-CoA ligase [Saccharopolyspora sp. ASAGF58]